MARIISSILLPGGLQELADLERLHWPAIRERIRLSGHPTNEGEEEVDDDKPEPDKDEEVDDDKPEPDKDEPDWKSHSRKHEREAKKERKQREALEKRLADLEAQGQSDSEKAIAKAREEAKAEAFAESQAERRHDRLEVSVTRLATTGVKVKDGDEEKTVKFADPDDAIVHIERAIKAGDVDEDDIYDSEGKVQTDALRTALSELLDRKPHLRAQADGAKKFEGSGDGGKGSGAGKGQEDMSVEEHLASISRHKK